MQLLTTSSLLALSLFVAQSNAKAVKVTSSLCKGGEATQTTTDIDNLVINGTKVNLVHTHCPQGFANPVSFPSKSALRVNLLQSSDRRNVRARQVGVCATYPKPQCQSATPCTQAYCEFNDETPVTADCNSIASSLATKSGTFLTQVSSVTKITYNTCEFRWFNSQKVVAEYSYVSWGQLGTRIHNNCNIILGTTDGWCLPDNGLWFTQVAAPSTPSPVL